MLCSNKKMLGHGINKSLRNCSERNMNSVIVNIGFTNNWPYIYIYIYTGIYSDIFKII